MIARLRRSGTSISTRSPCVSINQRRLRSTPARERLSSKRTRCPAESSRCARFEPTKPAPPVIRIGFDFPFLPGDVGVSTFRLLLRPLPLNAPFVFALAMSNRPLLDTVLSPVFDQKEFRG